MTAETADVDPAGQKRAVASGYDLVSYAYRADDYGYEGSGYERILNLVLPEFGPDDPVVELGCGCGIPVSRVLAPRCRLTGVDISRVQLARASNLVPSASFVRGDMASIEFLPGSLRAVVSFWAIVHVPLESHQALLARVLDWLQPGGLFLCTVGYHEWEGSEQDWLGVPGATMYWSHAGRETYRSWFADAGFLLEHEDFIPDWLGSEPSGATVFFARKPFIPAA